MLTCYGNVCVCVLPDYRFYDKKANTPNGALQIATLLSDLNGVNNVEFIDLRDCSNHIEVEFRLSEIMRCDKFFISAVSCQGNLINLVSKYIKKVFHCTTYLGGPHVNSCNVSKILSVENLKRLHPNIDVFVSGYYNTKEDIEKMLDTSINKQFPFHYHPNTQSKFDLVSLKYGKFLGKDNCVSRTGGWIRANRQEELLSQNIFFTHGCNYRCSFCANPTRKIEHINPFTIINEIRRRSDMYKIQALKIDDDDPFHDFDWNDLFLYLLENKEYSRNIGHIKYLASTRCDVHRGNYRKLKQLERFGKVGLSILGLGVEWASEDVLRVIKKGCNVSHIKDTIQKLHDNTDIELLVYSIFGLPGSLTEKAIDDMIEFIQWCKGKISHLSMTNFTPMIGSDIFENPEKYKSSLSINKEMFDWEDFYFVGNFKVRKLVEVDCNNVPVDNYEKYLEKKLMVYRCLSENGFLREETGQDIIKEGFEI